MSSKPPPDPHPRNSLWDRLRSVAAWPFQPPEGHKRALFPRWSNVALLAVAVLGAVTILGIVAALAYAGYHPAGPSGVAPTQPVPFSHRIHVTGLEINCLYCHSSAESAAPAGMPATRTCVACHESVWLQSDAFAAVRASLRDGTPIPWVRVNDLADFTFFHHGIHTTKGVGCETCHGRVDTMDAVWQATPLSMGWCLDCHRDPERHLRPLTEVTTMGYVPERPQSDVGLELKRRFQVREMTHCTTCHR